MGETVSLVYDPQDPKRIRITSDLSLEDEFKKYAAGAGLVFFVVAGWLLFTGAWP